MICTVHSQRVLEYDDNPMIGRVQSMAIEAWNPVGISIGAVVRASRPINSVHCDNIVVSHLWSYKL